MVGLPAGAVIAGAILGRTVRAQGRWWTALGHEMQDRSIVAGGPGDGTDANTLAHTGSKIPSV